MIALQWLELSPIVIATVGGVNYYFTLIPYNNYYQIAQFNLQENSPITFLTGAPNVNVISIVGVSLRMLPIMLKAYLILFIYLQRIEFTSWVLVMMQ